MSTTTEPRYVPQGGGSTRHSPAPVSSKRVKLVARALLHARAVEIMGEQGRLDPDYLAALAQAARENPRLRPRCSCRPGSRFVDIGTVGASPRIAGGREA